MTVKQFTVDPCHIDDIRTFVERWHYSGNVNGIRITQCFALRDSSHLIGAMIYGGLAMANAWKKYGETEHDVIELRRLCCIDDTPKNTESYFIGKTLRWLRNNTDHLTVVSYADTHHGHSGTIYKAANFTHVGMTPAGRIIRWGEREFHDKTIRTYYVNKYGFKELKPFAVRLRDALESGDAYYCERPPKHIYLFHLHKDADAARRSAEQHRRHGADQRTLFNWEW